MELTLVNSKVTGATAAITTDSSLKLKASKKTRIVGTTGYGVLTTSNSEINLNDAALEGATKALKATVNDKIKLAQGSRIAGKKGAIEAEGNFELDGTGATIDGGTGPGILAGYNARLALKQGALKGTPAAQTERKPTSVDFEGTRVEGEQKFPLR
jgi:hypothetical protein